MHIAHTNVHEHSKRQYFPIARRFHWQWVSIHLWEISRSNNRQTRHFWRRRNLLGYFSTRTSLMPSICHHKVAILRFLIFFESHNKWNPFILGYCIVEYLMIWEKISIASKIYQLFMDNSGKFSILPIGINLTLIESCTYNAARKKCHCESCLVTWWNYFWNFLLLILFDQHSKPLLLGWMDVLCSMHKFRCYCTQCAFNKVLRAMGRQAFPK